MLIDVIVKKSGVVIDNAENRPVRKLDAGRAGVVYKKKIYPLYEGNFIDIADNSFSKDQFTSCFAMGDRLIYASPPSDLVAAVSQGPLHAKSAVPEVQPVMPLAAEFVLDPDQRAVIEAAENERLIVDAGPGTGKTEVACRRVAWLVEECGINASSIILVSFTRTAVHEIRNRIASLTSRATANSVQIATIDSLTWQIMSGRIGTARLDGSFDENILRLVDALDSTESIKDYLATINHFIIDEAQDIRSQICRSQPMSSTI